MTTLFRKSTILLLLSLLIIQSCSLKRKFEETKSTNSISAYEDFIKKYPRSKYVTDLRSSLFILYEESEWDKAIKLNTENSFSNFISLYPESRHVKFAELKIKEIEVENAWNKTKSLNTIYGYDNFISHYSNSKYVIDAKNNIQKLLDNSEWASTINIGTIEAYKNYLNKFPFGLNKEDATKHIYEIEKILPEWNRVSKLNSPIAIRNFISKYPDSFYVKEAEDKLDVMEESEWESANSSNSIKKIRQYISNYPDGYYISEAEKKLIDLEVDAIFQGNHGKLPPLTKTSYNNSNSTISELRIYNNTPYTLTLRYSGIESRKYIFSPKQTRTVNIKNGAYRVAASVNAANVTNYAGKEQLDGGSYRSEYYIITKYY